MVISLPKFGILEKILNIDVMSKTNFVGEFEINASQKMLYPYIYTAGGLAQWFADDVTVNEDKIFNFIWEGEDHYARMVSHRTNAFVKFEFIRDDDDDPPYFEIRIEKSELTQATFLQITDYSEIEDEEEIRDLWEGLLDSLREIVGG